MEVVEGVPAVLLEPVPDVQKTPSTADVGSSTEVQETDQVGVF